MTRQINGTVVSHRNDGMGARLIAALNAIRIARDHDLPWHICWTTHGLTRPELRDPTDFLDPGFVAAHLSDFDVLQAIQDKVIDLTTLDPSLTRDTFLAQAASGRNFLSGLPTGVVCLPWEDPEAVRQALPACLDAFTFSGPVRAMMARIDATFAGAKLTAYHIRRGDIIHHPIASNKLWPSKYIPREFYETHVQRVLEDPAARVLVFSDTPAEIARMQAMDPRVTTFEALMGQVPLTTSARDFLELYAMSRCRQILGPPSSAFSETAALLGGGRVQAVQDALSPEDQRAAMDLLTARLEAHAPIFLNLGDVGQSLHFMVGHLRQIGQPARALAIIDDYVQRGLDKAYVYQLMCELNVATGAVAACEQVRALAYTRPSYIEEPIHLVNAYAGASCLAAGDAATARQRMLTANWLAPLDPLTIGWQNVAVSAGALEAARFYPFDPRVARGLLAFFPRGRTWLNDLNGLAEQILGPGTPWLGLPWEVTLRDWQFISGRRVGRAFSNQSKIRQAARVFQKDYGKLKDTVAFDSALGVFLRAMGDSRGAVERQRAAKAAEPDNALFRKRLSDALFARKQDDLALYQLREATALSGGHPCYRAELMRRLSAAGLRDEAQAEAESLFAVPHDFIEIHMLLSETFRRVPATRPQALEALERGLALTHGSPRLMQAQGRLLLQMGRVEAAQEVFDKMVAWGIATEMTHVLIYRLFSEAGHEAIARDLTARSDFDFEQVKARVSA